RRLRSWILCLRGVAKRSFGEVRSQAELGNERYVVSGIHMHMLFATLTLEREPLQWAEAPQALVNWLQSAGAIASLGLFLVFAARASFSFQRLFAPTGSRVSPGLVRLGAMCTIASWVGFILVGGLYVGSLIGIRGLQLPGANPQGFTIGDYLFGA